jgi:GNAT superfamily N-acetyltransferase
VPDLGDGVVAHDLGERPDLVAPARALGGVDVPFLRHDLPGELAALDRFARLWPAHSLVLVAGDRVVARACSVPLRLGGPDRAELPDHGWDAALVWAAADRLDGVTPTAACAIDIHVDPELRGRGLAGRAVAELRRATAAAGLPELVVPVRPPDKAAEPLTPMADYAARRRADGLPADRWLRVHVRAGGRIERVAPYAMTVAADLETWRRWTGLPFDRDGPVVVPGGLVPAVVDTTTGTATYVEPNVWVRHRTGLSAPAAPGAAVSR